MKSKKIKPCGNQNCSVSTGICENLTFGSGKLDDYGYWEFPCKICEDAYKAELEGIIDEALRSNQND